MKSLFSRISLKQHKKSFIKLQLQNLFLRKENSKSSSSTKENKQKWKKKPKPPPQQKKVHKAKQNKKLPYKN